MKVSKIYIGGGCVRPTATDIKGYTKEWDFRSTWDQSSLILGSETQVESNGLYCYDTSIGGTAAQNSVFYYDENIPIYNLIEIWATGTRVSSSSNTWRGGNRLAVLEEFSNYDTINNYSYNYGFGSNSAYPSPCIYINNVQVKVLGSGSGYQNGNWDSYFKLDFKNNICYGTTTCEGNTHEVAYNLTETDKTYIQNCKYIGVYQCVANKNSGYFYTLKIHVQ